MGPTVKKQKTGSKGKVVMKKGSVKPVIPDVTAPTVSKARKRSAPESESNSESSEDEDSEDENSPVAPELEELGSDDELDDEMDVADVSSGDESDEADESQPSDSDSDGEAYPKLKKKKNVDDGSSSFSTALNAIVGSKLKSYDRKDPILARNKTTLKKLESDKLEAKAKRALLAEKKDTYDKFRIKQILPSSSESEKLREIIDNDRKLKKIAQKGVVRLFNAILSTQIKTNQEIKQEKVGDSRKEELINEISKEKFLDLVQAAGDE